jgi:hypothetical protein
LPGANPMACKICGDDNATYRSRSGMFLCPSCHRDTPAKATRAEFDAAYWDGADDVPESIRREFYSDYRASKYGPIASYRAATSSPCW